MELFQIAYLFIDEIYRTIDLSSISLPLVADTPSFADSSNINVDAAINNLSSAVGKIKALVAAIAYVMGIYFIFRGIAMYKIFATQTFSSANRGEFAGPLVYIIVGAILVYLPSATDASLITLFGTPEIGDETSIIAYINPDASTRWAEIAEVLLKYMQLIGFIAFVRGWLILSKMGNSGSQPGSVGKGITHIVGGVLLMNIPDTMRILGTTFGFTGG